MSHYSSCRMESVEPIPASLRRVSAPSTQSHVFRPPQFATTINVVFAGRFDAVTCAEMATRSPASAANLNPLFCVSAEYAYGVSLVGVTVTADHRDKLREELTLAQIHRALRSP